MTPEISKTEDQTPKITGRFVWILFGFLIVFVYFFALNIPLLGPDEPRYAQVAREMLDRGDWITPTLGGFNWFEKPPLLYWLQIVSFKTFGVSEFAARLGPALFGLGTIASLWLLGKFVSERPPVENGLIDASGNKPSFAHSTALIAASTLGILVFSRGASFDIIITFPITAALVSFFIFYHRTDIGIKPPVTGSDLIPLFLFYFFIGIALLAKGLIGTLFPFAIVGVFYLLSRRWPSRTFVFSLLWGSVVAIAIASAWYLPMYQRHGYQFIDEFFVQHHFQRFTSNKYQHPQPFYFYLWVLPLMTLPWLPFFFASLWNVVKRSLLPLAKETSETKSPHLLSSSPLLFISLAWVLVPLIFFSLSGSKLPGYILPAVPGAVIITSIYVFDLVRNNRKWRKAILIIAASTFGATILLLIFAVPRFAESDSVKALIQAANNSGYGSDRVLMLHTISHNAEFYASNRLLRDADGKQRRLSGVNEVTNEIAAENGKSVLVLVPLEYLSQLTKNEKIETVVIKDNGELAIAAVSAK
ncbi:MAG: glycosyltransferase family 39 protein [Chloracidobacterium sp.]|nr:glycosyltransferase family 39 protein [Chloracidobacterium sp.]